MLRFNEQQPLGTWQYWRFKYISCYGLITSSEPLVKIALIQIHLMLRFNVLPTGVDRDMVIQIHLMLRFNIKCELYNDSFQNIQIHLMLRFNDPGPA